MNWLSGGRLVCPPNRHSTFSKACIDEAGWETAGRRFFED